MRGRPKRWMKYKPMGEVIPGTRFIAFKVPLKEHLCQGLQKNERFTPQDIIEGKNNISLIVDLTNTDRYYDKNEFENANISYVKVSSRGHVIPDKRRVSNFCRAVKKFLSEHPDDETLIGVHCTHGVNRTGYFICRYMINKMNIDPSQAIEDVGRARGHPIERINYLEDLKRKTPNHNQAPLPAKRKTRRHPARRNDDVSGIQPVPSGRTRGLVGNKVRGTHIFFD